MTADIARQNMVAKQLSPNLVSDALVLDAMRAVPREEFVPLALRAVAYADTDVALGGGRFLPAPLTIGRLLQAAHVASGDVVLDVGCATGYSSAVLARMAGMVVALESESELFRRAEMTLSEQGIDNVAVLNGPLAEGCPRQAPFDLIFIGGTLEKIPMTLCGQLADGGRLVMGYRHRGLGRLLLVERFGESFGRRIVYDTQAPDLPGFEPKDAFVF